MNKLMTLCWMLLLALCARASSWEKTTAIQSGSVVLLAVDNGSFSAELNGISSTSTKYGTYAQYESTPAGQFPLQVVDGVEEGSFAFLTEDGNYLCWKSGNSLNITTTLDENSSWNVSFDENDMVFIVNVAEPSRTIRWNNNSNAYRFACYTSAQHDIFLWKQTEDGEITPPVLTPSQSFVDEIYVEMQANEGFTIYYTLDGTVPTTESDIYADPFDISQTTTVKAIAVNANGQSSFVSSATYTKLEKTSIKEVQLSTGSSSVFIEGVVVAACASGAVIYDGTDYILYYNVNNELSTGEAVRIQGIPTTYGGAKQFTSSATVTYIDDSGIVIDDQTTHLSGDDIVSEHDAGVAQRRLVTFTGQLSVSGNYLNVSVDGQTDVLASILKPFEDYSSLDGQEVCVVGYEMYVTGKYLYFVATDVSVSSTLLRIEDWTILKNFYQSYGEDSWGWAFGDYPSTDDWFDGVTVENGYVTEINLNNKNISGNFPFELVKLPMLTSLNLSGNQMEGQLDEQLEIFLADNEMTESLRQLWISNNQLSGNLGAVAIRFPNLELLDATDNHFTEINPMISPEVELYYSNQQIDQTVEMRLKEGVNIDDMPSIILYDHDAQSFSETKWLSLVSEDDFYFTLCHENDEYTLDGNGVYRGLSGDELNVNDDGQGHTFSMAMFFQDGDANLDGFINVLDLQTVINYIYNEYDLFGFAAADLRADDIINVQDAVLLVNKMLEQTNDNTEGNTTKKRMPESLDMNETDAKAVAYVENGKLIINSSLPFAAFDICLTGTDELKVAEALQNVGFACSVRKTDNGVRIVGYSLARKTVEEGVTVLAEIQGEANVQNVMLAGLDAKEITCGKMPIATGIQQVEMPDNVTRIFRIPLDSRHAIEVYSNGKKTIVNDNYK